MSDNYYTGIYKWKIDLVRYKLCNIWELKGPGGFPGLQNRVFRFRTKGGFDSHLLPQISINNDFNLAKNDIVAYIICLVWGDCGAVKRIRL